MIGGAENMGKSELAKAQQASVFDGLDQDEQEQLSIIKASLQTIQHYFGRMAKLFGAVHDPRVPYLITYPLEALAFAGVLMFLCRLGARRQIALMFRGNGASAAKFKALFNVDTCPHGDTLDATFSRVIPEQVHSLHQVMPGVQFLVGNTCQLILHQGNRCVTSKLWNRHDHIAKSDPWIGVPGIVG